MEWIVTAATALYALIATLGWIDARKKAGIDLRIEANAPEGGKYTLRNHGNRVLHKLQLETEHLASYRIERAIFSLQLDPKEPASFEISRDIYGNYPDGVKIQYVDSWLFPRSYTVYVPLPPPAKEWDGATGEWVPREQL